MSCSRCEQIRGRPEIVVASVNSGIFVGRLLAKLGQCRTWLTVWLALVVALEAIGPGHGLPSGRRLPPSRRASSNRSRGTAVEYAAAAAVAWSKRLEPGALWRGVCPCVGIVPRGAPVHPPMARIAAPRIAAGLDVGQVLGRRFPFGASWPDRPGRLSD